MHSFRMLKNPIPYPVPGSKKAAPYTASVNGYGHIAIHRQHIRMLPEERKLLVQAAELTGCSLSELCRWSIRFVCEAVIKENNADDLST